MPFLIGFTISFPNFSGLPSTDTGGGDITLSRDPGDSGSITSEKNFDPYWANARNFLDIIDEKNLLCREIEKARIGQLVLFSGELIILDTRFTNALGKSETAVKAMADLPPDIFKQIQISQEIFANIASTIQVSVKNKSNAAWMTVGPDNMTVSIDDLMLKFGQKIDGEWAVIGVLDGLPSTEIPTVISYPMPQSQPEQMKLSEELGISHGGLLALNMAMFARQNMGRPLRSYGLTPLLIFREVAQQVN